MKSRINEDWAKSRMKKLCTDCQNRMIKKHTAEYERAIREGFECGLAVALKSQQTLSRLWQKTLTEACRGRERPCKLQTLWQRDKF